MGAPTVAYLQKHKTIYFRIYLEIGLAFLACVLIGIPIIELQIAVFIIQAFVRLQTFAYHFAYLAERFGFRYFGLLNGISSMVAGLFGLGGYGLQIFTIFKTKGSFVISYAIVGLLILSTLVFPVVLKKLDKKMLEDIDHQNKQSSLSSKVCKSQGDDNFVSFLQ